MEKEIKDKLRSIEERLSDIEDFIGLSHQRRSLKTESKKIVAEESVAKEVFLQPSLTKPIQDEYTRTIEFKENPGNWLAKAAVACFVLAAAFIIKLSIDSGWLTPARQIAIAVLLGITLIVSGFRILKSDREYASFLPAAGVIIFYMSDFAAFRYYNLISFEIALYLVGIISAFCIYLYLKIKHDAYPLTAAIGADIAPVLMGSNASSEFTIYYFLLCSAAFSIISSFVESRLLTIVSAYLSILITAVIGTTLNNDTFIAAALAAYLLIFTIGTYYYTSKNAVKLRVEEAWAFLPVLVIFYAAEYYFLERIQAGIGPWVSLIFVAILIGFYLAAKKYVLSNIEGEDISGSLIISFSAIVLFHSVYIELLNIDGRSWLFAVIFVFAALGSFKQRKVSLGGMAVIPVAIIGLIVVIEYLTMLYHTYKVDDGSWVIVTSAAVLSMWAVIIVNTQAKVQPFKDHMTILLGSAHLLAITALYRLTESTGSLAISISWLVYAVLVMLYAYKIKDKLIARSALLVLGFASAKALLYDASHAPSILRIVCLLFTGLIMYGCGLLMRKVNNWQ